MNFLDLQIIQNSILLFLNLFLFLFHVYNINLNYFVKMNFLVGIDTEDIQVFIFFQGRGQ